MNPSKNMIIKTTNLPRIGDDAVDENLKKIGRVLDVFGPVNAPYVTVRPSVENPTRFINQPVYAFPSKPRRQWRRR